LERKKGQTKKPLVLDFPDSAAVLDAESILAKSVSGHAAGAGDIVSMPRRSEERLQDVSVWFVCLVGSFIDNCVYHFHIHPKHSLSLTRAAEKIIIEENSDDLRKRIAELEENAQLKVSTVELQKSVDKSADAVISLR
jgi:hypothetical protein